MNRDNINPSNLNNSTLSGNIQNYDYLKQKKESFLAPTPSYKGTWLFSSHPISIEDGMHVKLWTKEFAITCK